MRQMGSGYRRFVVAASLAALTVTAGACGGGDDDAAAGDRTMITYATRTQASDPIFVYWTVAEEQGYFAEEGIEAEFVSQENGEAAVRQGNASLTSTGPEVLIREHLKDPDYPLVSFFVFNQRYNGRLVVPVDSPIRTLADLRGKRVALPTKAMSIYATTLSQLRSLGLDPEREVEWIVTPLGAATAKALQDREVDAVLAWDTAIATQRQLTDVEFRAIPNAPGFECLGGSVLAARKEDLERDRDAYVRYVRAIIRSHAFVVDDVRAAAEIHLRQFPQLRQAGEDESAAIAKIAEVIESKNESFQAPPESCVPDAKLGYAYDESWAPHMEILGAEGKISPSATYTNEILDEAYQGLDLDRSGPDARDDG
jgi:NitT/TauT family transport system substrate-binding protein